MKPNQEPVKLAPIPPYEYPAPPVARSSPGDEYPADEEKATRIRDIERRIEERPFQAPIIPTLTEAGRIMIEGGNEPEQKKRLPPMVQPFQRPPRTFITHVAPEQPKQHVIMNHPAQVEPLPYFSWPAPETQKPPANVSQPSPANLSEPSAPNLPSRAQSDNLADNLAPIEKQQKPRPQITKPLPERFKFTGRGVGRERTFFEVIDLLNFTQRQGDFPDGTTDRMRKYYKRTYPEYFSASKRAAGKRNVHQQKADRLRAEHRPRRRKVKPVLHTA